MASVGGQFHSPQRELSHHTLTEFTIRPNCVITQKKPGRSHHSFHHTTIVTQHTGFNTHQPSKDSGYGTGPRVSGSHRLPHNSCMGLCRLVWSVVGIGCARKPCSGKESSVVGQKQTLELPMVLHTPQVHTNKDCRPSVVFCVVICVCECSGAPELGDVASYKPCRGATQVRQLSFHHSGSVLLHTDSHVLSATS